MKKIIVVFLFLISASAFASDTFTFTKWKPFTNGTAVSFSDSVTITFNKNTKYRYSFTGFAKSKVDNDIYYFVFGIDCENHTVSLWQQGTDTAVVSEYLNPSHPVWAYRKSICEVKK